MTPPAIAVILEPLDLDAKLEELPVLEQQQETNTQKRLKEPDCICTKFLCPLTQSTVPELWSKFLAIRTATSEGALHIGTCV